MPHALQAFVAIFVVGAVLRSVDLLTKSHAERLAAFVFSISLPATILISLDRIGFDAAAWKIPLSACLITLPLIALSWLSVRWLQWPRARQGGFIVATGCINSVYFSYPVTLATFGEEGLGQAVLFDLGQTTLTLTIIYGLAAWYGGTSPTVWSPLVRFISSPPLWALLIILGLKGLGLTLPAWAHLALTPLHLTTTPLASLVLGLSITPAAVRRQLPFAMLGAALRMGGGLALGLTAVRVLDLAALQRAVVILVSAMPSAVTAVIFAAETKLDEELVASIVALSICLGIAFLPWLPRLSPFLIW